ncbi:MAG: ABC transporter substrate-binding protein [Thermodesulfobacteriota bacterium]
MTRSYKLVTVVLILSLWLVFPLSSSWSQPRKTLKVGYIPIVSVLPLYAAVNNGYFKAKGVEVKLIPMAGGAVIIPAIIGGSLDMGFSAYFPVIAARTRGIDLVIIAATVREIGLPQPYVGVVVRADSGINKAKDLEGKTFAVNTIKAVDWLTTSEWMAINGADAKKVNWVEIPFPAMGGALRTKKVDAITGVDPFMTIELGMGGVKIIGYPFMSVNPKLPVAGFVSTDSWVKKNRDLTDRFVSALYQGTDYINKNPAKRGELVAKFTRVKPALAAKLRFYPGFDRYIDAQALQKTVELAVKWGLISKRVNVKELALPGVLK